MYHLLQILSYIIGIEDRLITIITTIKWLSVRSVRLGTHRAVDQDALNSKIHWQILTKVGKVGIRFFNVNYLVFIFLQCLPEEDLIMSLTIQIHDATATVTILTMTRLLVLNGSMIYFIYNQARKFTHSEQVEQQNRKPTPIKPWKLYAKYCRTLY